MQIEAVAYWMWDMISHIFGRLLYDIFGIHSNKFVLERSLFPSPILLNKGYNFEAFNICLLQSFEIIKQYFFIIHVPVTLKEFN